LAANPQHRYLYAVDETNSQVAGFAIDAKSGALKLLNKVGSGGTGPAHLSVDRSGRFVLTANYTNGAVATFPIGADGSLGAAADGKAAGTNAHMILTDAANQHAFVPCLGSDYVAQYAFDAATGKLTASTPATAPAVVTG